jgi:hypothetical protein
MLSRGKYLDAHQMRTYLPVSMLIKEKQEKTPINLSSNPAGVDRIKVETVRNFKLKL